MADYQNGHPGCLTPTPLLKRSGTLSSKSRADMQQASIPHGNETSNVNLPAHCERTGLSPIQLSGTVCVHCWTFTSPEQQSRRISRLGRQTRSTRRNRQTSPHYQIEASNARQHRLCGPSNPARHSLGTIGSSPHPL